MKESNLHRLIMLEASKQGHRLFRNNIGALKDERGQWVRYGVGGPGGSDLIGWTVSGRFAAIEVKLEGGRVSDEQNAFVRAVLSSGGIAGIARSVDEAMRILSGDSKDVPAHI